MSSSFSCSPADVCHLTGCQNTRTHLDEYHGLQESAHGLGDCSCIGEGQLVEEPVKEVLSHVDQGVPPGAPSAAASALGPAVDTGRRGRRSLLLRLGGNWLGKSQGFVVGIALTSQRFTNGSKEC